MEDDGKKGGEQAIETFLFIPASGKRHSGGAGAKASESNRPM